MLNYKPDKVSLAKLAYDGLFCSDTLINTKEFEVLNKLNNTHE